MKIIEQGKDMTPPKTPWWVTTQVRCKNCKCIFELQISDRCSIEKRTSNRTTADDIIYFTCINATCNVLLNLKKQDLETKIIPQIPTIPTIPTFPWNDFFLQIFKKKT